MPTYRRLPFVDLIDSSDDIVHLHHEPTGRRAVVSDADAQIVLAVPRHTFADAATVHAELPRGPRDDSSVEAVESLLASLAEIGLLDTPDSRTDLGYDSVADLYDARPEQDAALFEVLDRHTTDTHWGDVLDVATGTGYLLGPLAARTRGTLHAVDLADRMLHHARERCRRLDLDVTLHHARAEVLPFDDDSLDLVVVGSALWFFDPERFFRECQRILRPHGFVAHLTTVYGRPFFERLSDHLIRPLTGNPNAAVGQTLRALPAWTELLHFECVPTTATLDSAEAMAAMAGSQVPQTDPRFAFKDLDQFDGRDLDWPFTFPAEAFVTLVGLPD
ncbi:MAG: class I SAM-dependent methyltransferase [Acidobacteriota bacterium]